MIEREQIQAVLTNYSVSAEIGRGAFGVVFEGEHRNLERPVAIKVLSETLAVDAQVRERFRREARILAGLDHPNVTRVFDYLEEDGVCLLVMELLKGGTVWEHYRNRSCSVATACAIGVSAAEGLHHAHERGALHREVKPENLMLSEQRDLKVTDFGIAKIVGDAARLTGTGMLLGTPVY
ncbi:MAG: serine/threonine-protein kinase, partial [Acidimicrobiia bacterium]